MEEKPENEEEKGAIHNIPWAFLGDILSRLDAKSLKRCECVSKSWLSLIRNWDFIHLHLKRQLPCVVFLQKKVRRFNYTLSTCNWENFAEISSQKFPKFKRRRPPLLLFMGSDNGILGLYDLRNKKVYLWNPTIKVSKTLSFSPHSELNHSVLGLGYDPFTTDFKVVMVSCPVEKGVIGTHNLFKAGNQVGIYSLRSNSWKTMAMPDIFSDFEPYTSDIIIYTSLSCSIVVNEAIHWKICYRNSLYHDQLSLGIVAFGLRMENFKLIKSPQIVEGSHVKKLANFSGCLSFFTFDEVQVVEVWVMKKYGDSESWFKYLSVNLLSLLPNWVGRHPICTPVSFLSNGILVISCIETGYWCWYDTKSKRLENMCRRFGVSDFTTYVESIFLSEKGENFVACD
ncbi:F-box protein CPR1-like [Humulus lupulus]|uniref:F-box protein CPR1-like n=1 Tax=Humulus lupulus TaxID=3486 RepID=UPI002B415816|nr:F-box protein CPR1-like [Humulus lupulus]